MLADVFNSGIRLAAAAAAVAAGRGGCDKERNGNDAGGGDLVALRVKLTS